MVETQVPEGCSFVDVPVRLDLGAGVNKKEGFLGVDILPFEGVDVVCDLTGVWPWEDNSVDEVNASHVVEHFNPKERCHFYNELYRVLKPGCKATITVPYWKSSRAYGDPTHQWPPVSEMSFFYLSREWRLGDGKDKAPQAPHTDVSNIDWGYSCDFDATWGYALDGEVAQRNQEFQQFALKHYTESAQDLIATVTKK